VAITCYAHENQHKYSSLQHFDQKKPISALFTEFVEEKLGPERLLGACKIEIRFVFTKSAVVSIFTHLYLAYILTLKTCSLLRTMIHLLESEVMCSLGSKRKHVVVSAFKMSLNTPGPLTRN
jgi:hypothetical protein